MERARARGWLYLGATALTAALLAVAARPADTAAATPKRAAIHAAPSPAGPPPPPTEEAGPSFDTSAQHAMILEADTGTVLYEKAADERMPPASMSKMMTAYVVFSLLKEGRAKLTDTLPVSTEAWRLGGSKMFVPVNGHVSIDDLLQGMIVESGNDACVVLAQGLAGSQAEFVDMMNRKAHEIGLKDSHFADVDGLPNPDHWMTARDLATLALRTIDDFPQYYHYYAEKKFAFSGITQPNRNPLLDSTPGADGLKTGHTEESGYSLTGSVVRGNRRIILVLAGMPTWHARVEESQRAVEWAFRTFDDYRLLSANDAVANGDVWLGAEPTVPMTLGRNLVVTLTRRARREMKVTVSYDSPIPAPVKKGEEIGQLIVTAPGMQTVQLPLYAGANVPAMSALGRIATRAAYLVWGDRH